VRVFETLDIIFILFMADSPRRLHHTWPYSLPSSP
jgi:hypothetical protein